MARRESLIESGDKIAQHFGVNVIISYRSTNEWVPDHDMSQVSRSSHESDAEHITTTSDRDGDEPLASERHVSHAYSSEALKIQERRGQVEIIYDPPLTQVGLTHLKWAPSMYALIWAGYAGLISLIGADLVATANLRWAVVIVISLLCLNLAYTKASTQIRALSHTTIITLEEHMLSLMMLDHSKSEATKYEQPADELSYARLDLDLDDRSATLSVGATRDNIVLMYIAEGWLEGRVEDLMRVEKLIEQRYDVV